MAREVLGAAVGLPQWRRLEWASALQLGAVPVGELPPWQLERQNLSRRDIGVDLVSLDGKLAVQCKRRQHGTVATALVQHFVSTAVEVYNASRLVLVVSGTASLTADGAQLLQEAGGEVLVMSDIQIDELVSRRSDDKQDVSDDNFAETADADAVVRPSLRQCQIDCLEACTQGARVIEMACGSGKTQVMRELADKCFAEGRGRVLVLVPSRVLLMQLGQLFPELCLVGTGHNDRIDWAAPGYVAVYDSAHLLSNLSFAELYVDEAHHPLPKGCPEAGEMYRFSATHSEQVDFRYALDRAIGDGVLSDYDITVPIVGLLTHLSDLAMMLRRGAGRYRRVLAYCNTVEEAKRFQEEAKNAGLAAWHINGDSSDKDRQRVLREFSGPLQRPVHVLVTVQVLGEGVNIGNADTCIFVEPRRSYVAILQAMGRVLRRHPDKPLAHVILPAVPETYLHGGGGGSPVAVPLGGMGSKTRSASATFAAKVGGQLPNVETVFGQETVDATPCRSQEMISAAGIPRQQLSTTPGATQTVLKVGSVIPYSVAQHVGARSNGSTASSRNGDDSSTVQIASRAGVGRSGRTTVRTRFSAGFDNAEYSPQEEWPGITSHSAPTFAIKGSVSRNTSKLDEVLKGPFTKLAPLSVESSDTELSTVEIRRPPVPKPAEAEAALHHSSSERYALTSGTAQERHISSDTTTTKQPLARRHLPKVGQRGRSLGPMSALIPELGQLGRFLQVMAAADSRLADALLQNKPGGRVRFVDARGLQPGAVQLSSTPEVISKVWDQLSSMARSVFAWRFRLTQLDEFCKTYGHLPRYNMQKELTEDERKLGAWLHNQAQFIRSGRISSDRLHAMLNANPKIAQRVSRWADDPNFWARRLQDLVAFINCNDRLPRSAENSVGIWLRSQGKRFKAGRLSGHQLQGLERLEQLRPVLNSWRWDVTEPWATKFGKLQTHTNRTKSSANSNARHGSNREMRLWIQAQRDSYSRGLLTQKQVDLLVGEGLSFQRRETTLLLQWKKNLQTLIQFVQFHGCLPKGTNHRYATTMHHKDEQGLYLWAWRQRALNMQGKLHVDRAFRLTHSHPIIAAHVFGSKSTSPPLSHTRDLA
ncbi:unnamed protein product, partial [Polarella glacialis]